MNQPKEENDRRNHFMINLHESMGPDRDRTRDPLNRSDILSGLIWIQTDGIPERFFSDGIPERIFFKNVDFKNISR